VNLTDPVLRMTADVLDDLEDVRIANENRMRQLTRSVEDKDGEVRGLGLEEDDEAVLRLQVVLDLIEQAEKSAIKSLERHMRREHPLGPWLKAQPGVGDKQGARLLAAIGDPYMRPEITREDGTVEPARPRTVSELWAYAGMHVVDVDIPGDHSSGDTQMLTAVGEQTGGHPDQRAHDAHRRHVGMAAARKRGQLANWNAEARMRAYLVAAQCVKQPDGTVWRDVYTAGRAKYADAVHRAPCVRCGPSGKPAVIGSPLNPGHCHARAIRLVAKGILRELWREAGRLHGDDTSVPVAA
jgi:hypothetical protein